MLLELLLGLLGQAQLAMGAQVLLRSWYRYSDLGGVVEGTLEQNCSAQGELYWSGNEVTPWVRPIRKQQLHNLSGHRLHNWPSIRKQQGQHGQRGHCLRPATVCLGAG